jgi:S1-C subfamily serine protease
MNMRPMRLLAGVALVLAVSGTVRADNPFHGVVAGVNPKLVKLYGSGGFQRLTAYGTGVLVSAEGHVLTVASPLLDTPGVRVHLSDGRRLTAKVLVTEPDLDAALLKIDAEKGEKLDLPFFDIAEAAKQPPAQPGDWVLAFSNQFQIATRDEPMTVQRGVVAAVAKLHGRRGIFDAPYTGEVYVVDAITNNPGAGGGALTTRDGRLLGLVGKELRNTLSETWLNYAVPLTAKAEVRGKDGQVTAVTLVDFVTRGMKGEYKPPEREKPTRGPGGYTGIILVPDVVERTPPYIEEVLPGSPAAGAGLKPDDLIVYLDGEPVPSIKAFREMLGKTRPGMTVKVEVRRGDRLTAVDVKLADAPRK